MKTLLVVSIIVAIVMIMANTLAATIFVIWVIGTIIKIMKEIL